MKKLIIAAVLIALLSTVVSVQAESYVTPARATPTVAPWIDGDTFVPGGQVPDWVTVCTDTNVYGNPYGHGDVLYSVLRGEVVRVHDTNQDNTWVMIKSARWIPISSVCEWW